MLVVNGSVLRKACASFPMAFGEPSPRGPTSTGPTPGRSPDRAWLSLTELTVLTATMRDSCPQNMQTSLRIGRDYLPRFTWA